MNSEPLKPCDICDSSPEPTASIGGWFIFCNGKVCSEQQGWYTKEEAIKAWNTLTTPEKESE